MKMARKSLTLVNVGPVITESSSAWKNPCASLFSRRSDGQMPRSPARRITEDVNLNTGRARLFRSSFECELRCRDQMCFYISQTRIVGLQGFRAAALEQGDRRGRGANLLAAKHRERIGAGRADNKVVGGQSRHQLQHALRRLQTAFVRHGMRSLYYLNTPTRNGVSITCHDEAFEIALPVVFERFCHRSRCFAGADHDSTTARWCGQELRHAQRRLCGRNRSVEHVLQQAIDVEFAMGVAAAR